MDGRTDKAATICFTLWGHNKLPTHLKYLKTKFPKRKIALKTADA